MTTLGQETELQPKLTAILRRWTSVPGTATVPGYAVIQTYAHALFCPRTDLRASSVSDLASITAADCGRPPSRRMCPLSDVISTAPSPARLTSYVLPNTFMGSRRSFHASQSWHLIGGSGWSFEPV